MYTITDQFQRTRSAASSLAMASGESRNLILLSLATLIRENSAAILLENQKDLDLMPFDHPMRDRLYLTHERLENLAASVISVTQLPNPYSSSPSSYSSPSTSYNYPPSS